MVRRADDKIAAGPKDLLCKPRQITRFNEVLDYLSSNSHVKALGANSGRIVIYSELVKCQFRCRTACEPNSFRARLATNDFVSATGKLATQRAIDGRGGYRPGRS